MLTNECLFSVTAFFVQIHRRLRIFEDGSIQFFYFHQNFHFRSNSVEPSIESDRVWCFFDFLSFAAKFWVLKCTNITHWNTQIVSKSTFHWNRVKSARNLKVKVIQNFCEKYHLRWIEKKSAKMNKSCSRCNKIVYPIEELKCLDKVSLRKIVFQEENNKKHRLAKREILGFLTLLFFSLAAWRDPLRVCLCLTTKIVCLKAFHEILLNFATTFFNCRGLQKVAVAMFVSLLDSLWISFENYSSLTRGWDHQRIINLHTRFWAQIFSPYKLKLCASDKSSGRKFKWRVVSTYKVNFGGTFTLMKYRKTGLLALLLILFLYVSNNTSFYSVIKGDFWMLEEKWFESKTINGQFY